jgi:hypothetical protein
VTSKQLKRLALAINGSYIVYGAEAEGLGHLLSEKDLQKFYAAQLDLGYAMLKKAGFDRAMSYEEIIEAIK